MIQVGQVLDKYELLERVGQGGMAVVYRGIDRSLKRVVAVKVLHKHLSDYQEARDRFEREAQAVAKLRHENILEIFDYSGAATAEELGSSYIVTEFIDGRTLKQVVTDRPIAFPEIGAMIILQVCRALAHAHAAGILHRDVKPENIMVRSDGVVKLMDFGISHMVDLERLTVTGQLLGSPAYMAPEHVEGRPLDFRTDVFAVGIVLYQLCVGKLPFEGKNPHEVLKRIAECKFVDPRQANPMIGNRLGRIILRAMAAEPADRYPAIGEMVIAIESYLDESGIASDKVPGELSRYFQGPAAYEQALEVRLVDHLTQRGARLLADDNRAAALDVFDRVLTIDPGNSRVLEILDGINRRRRLRSLGAGAAVAAVIVGGALAIERRMRPPPPEPPPRPAGEPPEIRQRLTQTAYYEDVELPADPDAGTDPATDDAATAAPPSTRPDAAVAAPIEQPLLITVDPAVGSEIQFGDGADFVPVPDSGQLTRGIDRELTIRVRNACCGIKEERVRPGQPQVAFSLVYRPAQVIPLCDWPGVDVKLNDKLATLGKPNPVFFEKTIFDNKTVKVTFTSKDNLLTREVNVVAGKTYEVACSGP